MATNLTPDHVVATTPPAVNAALGASDVLGTAGVTWTNDGTQLLYVQNSDASSHVITFSGPGGAYTIGAGETRFFGPFPVASFGAAPTCVCDADALHAFIVEAAGLATAAVDVAEATVTLIVTDAHTRLKALGASSAQSQRDRRIAKQLARRLRFAYREIHGQLPS